MLPTLPHMSIQVEPGWEETLQAVRTHPGRGRVGVLGAMGTGKSTLVRWLGERLAADHLGLTRLVLDPPGFLNFPAGHSFHLHLLELLDPDHLIVLDGAALAPVLAPIRRRARPRFTPSTPRPP